MSFGVKNPMLQIDFMLVCKQEVQVLQCFAQKKGLHHVFWPEIEWIFHISNRRVSVQNFGILFNSLQKKHDYKAEFSKASSVKTIPEKYSSPNLDMFCCQSRNKGTTNFQ